MPKAYLTLAGRTRRNEAGASVGLIKHIYNGFVGVQRARSAAVRPDFAWSIVSGVYPTRRDAV
jgi:hypothetical protein